MLCVRNAACALKNAREQRADTLRDHAHALQKYDFSQIFGQCKNPYEIWLICELKMKSHAFAFVRAQRRLRCRDIARNALQTYDFVRGKFFTAHGFFGHAA